MSLPNSPIYDIAKTFEENATFGPFWNEKLPSLSERQPKYSLLGQPLSSLFGVSACPLTFNARSIHLLSQLGYDILTYKSVRSVEWHGNVFPQWLYVDFNKQLDAKNQSETVKADFTSFGNDDTTMVNSFGIHSIKPEYWQADFELAQQKIGAGQVLILSLMFTPQQGQTLVDDGRKVAQFAAQTSAKIFEANFACPNTDGGLGLIYEDVDLSIKICIEMKKVLGDRPLLVKVGYYKNFDDLKKFMEMTKGVISGISGINTYSMKIVGKDDQQIFPGRPTAGISGAGVRNFGMEQAKKIVEFKKELHLNNFVVIGIGGVTKPEHISTYLDLGADAVQTAVGAWADPYLASKYLKTL